MIGAGTMGSGIAAHLANIGFNVTLLDVSGESVRSAFDRAKAAKPPHFYVPNIAETVRLGSIQDNLNWVSEADWVCEAIVEKMDLKKSLFEKIEPILNPFAMISTNTSGLEIRLLAEGRSESFRKRFIGTHFFNPPRYLKLLELIPTGDTDPAATEAYKEFLEERAGRRVVIAKDTPGFIANRFGMWSMFHAIHTAEKLSLSIEQVDAICGPFLGRPRTGAFRLNDLVGLDIMQDIARNLIERCAMDPHTDTLSTPRSMATLMERGHLGAKSGAGYYKREGKELLAIDLGTLAYRQTQDVDIPSLKQNAKMPIGERLAATLEARDEAGEYLRSHLIPVLQYANYLKEEISFSVQDFDRVMKWGFGWEMGPFELVDAIGGDAVSVSDGPFYESGNQKAFDGTWVALPDEPHFKTIQDFPIKATHDGFVVRDLGDGIQAMSLTTKMGTINPVLVDSLSRFLDENKGRRMVLTSEGKHFSAGFDLQFFADRIAEQDWDGIDAALIKLQELTQKLSESLVVATVFGYCLGAGTELAIACPKILIHPEANMGLPEMKVGLLPGGAGAARLANRSQAGGAKNVVEICMNVSQGLVSSNAAEARSFGYLRSTDILESQPDRMIHAAKQLALHVEANPEPTWSVPAGPIMGMIDQAQQALKTKSEFSDHDMVIADKIKHVFTKPSSLEDAFKWERSGFIELCKQGLSNARIKHMLETGKPLRN